jgi:predicted nuclease of predicted toxin-antitoxin system
LQGKPDSIIVDVCVREKRVLVTLDLDFADIRAYPPDQYPGLIVLRVHQQDKQHVIQTFEHVISVLDRERIDGRLWIVEERRIRIRGESS